MKASYELTPDDYAAFGRFHISQSPALCNQGIGCIFGGALAMLLLPAVIVLTDEAPLQTALNIWPLLLGPLLFPLLAVPYLRWRTSSLMKKTMEEGFRGGSCGGCDLTLEADGIRESNPTGETTRSWSSVEKAAITPHHLFIYTSGIEAFVVPRRAFASDDAFEAFVQQVAERSHVQLQRFQSTGR